jgi:hypothetical protein
VEKKTKSPHRSRADRRNDRTIRGVRVMLDRDLAKIYGVPAFRFNEAIKRNRHRFPASCFIHMRGVRLFEVANCDVKVGEVIANCDESSQ